MNNSERAIKNFFGNNPTVNSKKGGSRKEPFFSLRVSESEKYANDGEWFKEYMEYVVPYNNSYIEDFEELKLAYEIYNDDLSGYKDAIDKFCNPYGENMDGIEEEIQAYPKLHKKVDVLVGEFLKRGDNYRIALITMKAIKDKDNEMLEKLKASLEEDVRLEVEKLELELQGKDPQEVQKYIEGLRTQLTPEAILNEDYQSELEIFFNKAVKYCYFDQDIKTKKLESLKDAIISDRTFVYSGWRFGKPFIELRNILFSGYHKSPNEMFTHKGDQFWYKKPVTIADVYNNYGHLLSDDDIETLGFNSLSSNYRLDKRHSMNPNEFEYIRDTFDEEVYSDLVNSRSKSSDDKSIGLSQSNGTSRIKMDDNLVWETHLEFKAFKEVIFLSYLDEYNDPITVVVSKSFKIPDRAEKIKYTNRYGMESVKYVWKDDFSDNEFTAEKLYIPRKYEIIRLGADVYPVYREVPFQTTNLDDPYSTFSLSTFGAILTARNAKSRSLLQRAINPYFQYLYVKHVQNKELAKYQGYIQSVDLDQIPQKLGEDFDGNLIRDPVATWMLYRKKLGVDFYSGSQKAVGQVLPNTRSPGSTGYMLGMAQDIFTLEQLAKLLDNEISMAMGISPQRESQYTPYSNVTDNQQAIITSSNITESYFYYIDILWRDIIYDYVKNFRTYCEMLKEKTGENPIFQYVLPNGTKEVLKVTDKMLEPHSFGMYITNAAKDGKYYETMMGLSQAFAQNAGEGITQISNLIRMVVDGESPAEIHKLLKVEEVKQQQRAQDMETAKIKAQEEADARIEKMKDADHNREIEKIDRKGEWDIKREQVKSFINQDDQDSNDNAVPDQLEIEKFRVDTEFKTKQLKQKDRELDIKEKAAKNKQTVKK